MALERSARPLARSLQCTRHNRIPARSITATVRRAQDETTSSTSAPSPSADPTPSPPPPAATEAEQTFHGSHINPEQVSNPRRERLLFRERKQLPVGSRRRRAALASSANIPFEALPYQCFQEARKVLLEDRSEKVAEIEELTAKIAQLSAQDVPPEKEATRERRLKSMREHIEKLKIWASINDPLVKKNFEDGFGDMNKPIYRHLADLKWRSHKREILMQRIKQMKVVPDVFPAIDPTVSTALSFGRTKVAHGDFVLAATSQRPPVLEVQSYAKGKKLVSIAVVSPDVPNVERDAFDYRCHFLAVNVEIDPTRPVINLAKLSKQHNIIQGWLPPYSQKGAPYQRLAVFVLEQPSSAPAPANRTPSTPESTSEPTEKIFTLSDSDSNLPAPARLDAAAIRQDARHANREDFILRSFVDKYSLRPIGVDLFRSQWDETTALVMRRNGIVGHDVEFKRKRVEPLPYQRLKGERYR